MISIDADTFVGAVGSTSLAVSTDVAREHLNVVLVRQIAGRLFVVGTNGHWLARYETTARDAEKGEFLIPLAHVKDLLSAAKKASRGGFATVDLCQIDDKIQAKISGNVFQFPGGKKPFPPFEQVIPQPLNKKATCQGVGIGTEYLAKVAKAFEVAAEKSKEACAIYMEVPGSARDPIVFSKNGCPLLCVVMPVDLKGITAECRVAEEPAA